MNNFCYSNPVCSIRCLAGIFGLLVVTLLSGCEGRSLASDDAVFSQMPPRRSLINAASKNREEGSEDDASDIVQVSSSTSVDLLKGNTVVAEVNGEPIFVDDIAGSLRLKLEAEPQLTVDQRQHFLHQAIRENLDQRVREEVVLQALQKKVPEEQQDSLRSHLEDVFQDDYLPVIMEKGDVKTAEEFEAALANEGLNISLLKEAFFRIQMVNGYIDTLTEQKLDAPPGRPELLAWYDEHIDEFTPEERLRWQEIRVSRDKHGPDGSRQRISEIISRLKAGEEFDAVARAFSDSSSAENNGNRGWLKRGELVNRELERTLFGLNTGQVTTVIESDDYLAIYRVARHEYAKPRPFDQVQAEIKQQIDKDRKEAAKQEVIDELTASASVRTILDRNVTDRR